MPMNCLEVHPALMHLWNYHVGFDLVIECKIDLYYLKKSVKLVLQINRYEIFELLNFAPIILETYHGILLDKTFILIVQMLP